jgi:hypothetical protein
MSAAVVAALVGVASANSVEFVLPTGSTQSGNPVSAEADITTGAGTISLTLKNLTVNPKTVAQNLSAFFLTLNGAPGSNSLSSMSGSQIDIDGSGNATADAHPTVTSGWVESSSGDTLKLDVLAGSGHAGPADTIVGAPGTSGLYGNADGSIASNPAHNPFINQVATFTFSAANVTATTNITGVTFQFGTTDGQGQLAGVPAPVPLPPAVWGGLGLFGAMFVGRKVRRSRVA